MLRKGSYSLIENEIHGYDIIKRLVCEQSDKKVYL